MREINTGGPAFPFTCQGPTTAPEIYYGMTLRDYFAAKAMQGMLQAFGHHENGKNVIPSGLASYAYDLADAMLQERSGL